MLADQKYLDRLDEYNNTIDPEYPKYYQCHINFRPVHLPKEIHEVAKAAFNLEDQTVIDEEREQYTIEWLSKYEMPIFKQCSTIAGIVKLVKEGFFKEALVDWEVKELK